MLRKVLIFSVFISVISVLVIFNSQLAPAQADQPNILETESTIFLPVIHTSKPLMTSYTFLNKGLWTVYIPSRWADRREQPYIASIKVDLDETIWFATTGSAISLGDGIFRLDGNNWIHYHPRDGFPFEISSMAVTPDGDVWFGTYCCGVTRFDGKNWVEYTTDEGLPSNSVRSMAATSDGGLWIGTSNDGSARFNGTTWEHHTEHLSDFVGHIEVLSDNTLLFSTSNNFARLVQFDGENWQEFETPWTANGKYTTDIAEVSDDSLWFTTEYLGAYQLVENNWTHYTTTDGLASNRTHCIETMPNSSVWIGTEEGISHFDGQTWETYSVEDGLPSKWIYSIAIDPDGSLWFGAHGSIIHYQPDH